MSSSTQPEKNGNANGHKSPAAAAPKRPYKTRKPQPKGKPPPKPHSQKESFMHSFKQMRLASARPLPTEMGDGRYNQVAKRPGLREDVKRLTMADFKTLKDIITAKLKGETQQDDKTMIMERTIQLVAGLSDHSTVQEALTNDFIDQLWNSLDHPPLLYMGPEFKWRQPDGSNNNPLFPKLGAAGTPYSRTVKPKVLSLGGGLPDPETVFETVMARDGFRGNPNNVSSILWYWATIVIHDLFWTNMKDPNQNDSSSYLDLSPLYGHSKEMCDSVRTFKDGLLKADAFADKRLIGNPPGVCVLLVMFNRFHNHVAANMAAVNEGGRFTKPSPELTGEAAEAAWAKYDEELFQTARLVTSGLYINITLVDYVRNIIGMNRVDSTWTLDPRQEMGTAVGTSAGAEAGVGNVVSAEFNLCYRWHSCISEMDEQWIEDFYTQLLGDDYGSMNMQALMKAVMKFEATIPKDPGERTFSGMQRGPDGRFSDDDLVDAIATAIEQPGGAFGGRNVPRIMKPVEMLGIMRGRRWNLAGLNEFRKHFGLKAYETFEDINSDPAVAESLRNLYMHPDNVELYPGIVAEEMKQPMTPGVGIAPTFTISRVVLSDAVSLVRGDRHYTTDYNPQYLTNWGFTEANYDLGINHGCVFYKLFLRAFPDHFKQDSIYAHYPMVTPDENRKIMTSLERFDRFSYDRPAFRAPRVQVTTYEGVKQVLESSDKYRIGWQEGLGHLFGGAGHRSMLGGHSEHHATQRKLMSSLLYKEGWRPAVSAYYAQVAKQLLADKSYQLFGSTQVDIVRDVGNLAATHFVSRLFNLPLKTAANPKGVVSEQELYSTLEGINAVLFHDTDVAKSFPLRQAAREAAERLAKVVELDAKLPLALFTSKPGRDDPLGPVYGGNAVMKGLKKGGLNLQEIVWGHILPTAGAIVPEQGQMFAQAVDFYLSKEAEPYRAELVRVAALPASEETDRLLLGYAMEGVRLSGGAPGLHREAAVADTIDGGLNVRPGDRVFLSLAGPCRDAAHFPAPETVDPRRPVESYLHYGLGAHASLGRDVGGVALTELLRAVFRKKNLRRVPGGQGVLGKVLGPDGSTVYMTEDWSKQTVFPTTMKVMWDEL